MQAMMMGWEDVDVHDGEAAGHDAEGPTPDVAAAD
jgi:hypothetical protein